MPKKKTHKTASKRFKISGRKKLMRRKARQGHFNARATGNQTRNKRGILPIAKVDEKPTKELLPYM